MVPTSLAQPSNLVLKCDYHEEDFIYWPRPSELELTQLAARMACNAKTAPKQLAARAWQLYWECCKLIKEDHRKVQTQLEFDAHCDAEQDHFDESAADGSVVPAPKAFPVSFAKAEQLLLRRQNGGTSSRGRIVQEYLFAELVGTCIRPGPKPRPYSYWKLSRKKKTLFWKKLSETVTARYGQLCKRVFEKDQYVGFALAFLKWHRRYKSALKSKAARARWKKQKKLAKAEPIRP